MSNSKAPHYTSNSIPHNKGILQKSYDYEQHETPEHKIKWDEDKLRLTEKQKEIVTMKIDEPNTPFIRYDSLTDTVTNLKDIPKDNAYEEPDDFSLDDNEESAFNNNKRNSLDEWDKLELKEKQEQEEAAKRKHEEFERKRAQHYFREGKRV